MKKILMTLAAVAVAATMNAQVWVGGELGFTSKHTHANNPTQLNLDVKPEIGYNLDDKFAVAIQLGYSYSTREKFDNVNGMPDFETNSNTWSIKPYLRYTFVKAGNFAAFIDGGLNFSTTHGRGLKKNYNTVGVFVNPGIAYNVSDKVSLVAHLGDGLFFNHTGNAYYAGDATHPYAPQDSKFTNSFGLKLLNGVSFGAYYNF